MRTSLPVIVALGAIALAAASSAVGGGSVTTLALSSGRVVYGQTVTLSGVLASGRAGERVTVLAQAYGAPAPRPLAMVRSGGRGRWSYRVRPTVETAYLARAGAGASEPVTVAVRPALSLRPMDYGSLMVRVKAGRSFAGRFVELQRPRGRWQTIARQRLGLASSALFVEPLAAGSAPLRAAMSVNEAGVGYLGGMSTPLLYRATTLTLRASSSTLRAGSSLLLTGRLLHGAANEPISIEAWPSGRAVPRRIATAITGPGGRWSLRVRPGIETAYAAQWGPLTSARLLVDVRPSMSVRELGNGEVVTSVHAGRSLRGRLVELQNWMPLEGWRTVARKPLGPRSSAAFAVDFPTIALRFAMSVNQAGAGLLGSWSHMLIYHRV